MAPATPTGDGNGGFDFDFDLDAIAPPGTPGILDEPDVEAWLDGGHRGEDDEAMLEHI